MANSKTSGDHREYAIVNMAPDAAGYWTNAIYPRRLQKTKHARDVFFSVRDYGSASVMIITVQFKEIGDSDWSDYGSVQSVQRKILEDKGAGTSWRAGVKHGDYTSGAFTFGWDW